MSKVQSPKSKTEPAETRKSSSALTQAEDFRPWTLDFGLKVTDVRKSFLTPNGERVEVLRSVSFSVNPGESVAIVGASGAGKSTLLNLLGGLEAPDHGSIRVGDLTLENAGRSALARFRSSQIGFVFQFHHLLPDLTAIENVSLPLLIRRTPRNEAAIRATQMLEEVGLAHQSKQLAGNLSGGEQQRVALCRALVGRPRLVLADEPTGNLDATIANEIAHSLIAFAKKLPGIVVLATHSQNVANLCDRVLILREGRILPSVDTRPE